MSNFTCLLVDDCTDFNWLMAMDMFFLNLLQKSKNDEERGAILDCTYVQIDLALNSLQNKSIVANGRIWVKEIHQL